MNTAGRESLWGRLRAAALVEGDVPPPDTARSPWYVCVMLGVAGWIGALFMIGFLGVGFEFVFKNTTVTFVTGAAVCAGAAVLFRANPHGNFTGQFGLAVSLAGQALMIYALARVFELSFSAAAL
ncbi:MAG: DUF4401 domain-containing protein, partial [Betaproteobacteria bacterium]|nr:DUF4401 domain-containing protein [Betaproteobacteria bacterium]